MNTSTEDLQQKLIESEIEELTSQENITDR
jgi:hypothetical protein